MKHFYRPVILSLTAASIGLSSCSTKTLSLQVMKPAQVMVSPQVKNLLILNSSAPSNKVMNVLQSLISHESPWENKEGAEIELSAVGQELAQSDRFVAKRATEILQGSPTGSALPPPLPWYLLDTLDKRYDADAVLSLELFTSDYQTTNSLRNITTTDNTGKSVVVKRYVATATTTVTQGYRLYNVSKRTIIDERVFSRRESYNSPEVTTLEGAMANLSNRNAMVNNLAAKTGREVGLLLIPHWETVNRTYYKKGSDALERSARYIGVSDWDGAENVLIPALQEGDSETKGKVAFNLALSYEVQGNLGKALDYAKSSYTDYGNKKAKFYVEILNSRVQDQLRLQQQTGGQ